jgi:hypothetical protein
MLKFIKSFFKKPEPVAAAQPVAEYKVETPVATIVPAGTEASVIAPVVEAKPAKAKKAPAAKKTPAAKKPRAPKKPKAE